MVRDLLADYEQAQLVALSWAETAKITAHPRHVDTALACSAIATERLQTLLFHRPDVVIDARFRALRSSVAAQAAAEQSRVIIEDTQAMLDRLGGAYLMPLAGE